MGMNIKDIVKNAIKNDLTSTRNMRENSLVSSMMIGPSKGLLCN